MQMFDMKKCYIFQRIWFGFIDFNNISESENKAILQTLKYA